MDDAPAAYARWQRQGGRRLMPKRTDIESILVIGSGPIVIGQACEFDYSGTQACRVLRSEGYRVILANSNPATIMTDPEVADRTYVEPLVADVLAAIIAPRATRRPLADARWPDGSQPRDGARATREFSTPPGSASSVRTPMRSGQRRTATCSRRRWGRSASRCLHRGSPPPSTKQSPWANGSVFRSWCVRASSSAGRVPGSRIDRDELVQVSARGLAASPVHTSARRALDRRVEGVRARSHARPRRQLRRRLLHREPRPDGSAHRRLHNRRPGTDPVRRRVPGDARRRVRVHPSGRGRDRRVQHPVRGEPRKTARAS